MKSKFSPKVLTGVLALSLAIPVVSFASGTEDTSQGSTVQLEQKDIEKSYPFMKGVNKGNKQSRFSNLDEETKQKLEEIHNQVEVGTLTHEQAQAKMKELGIKPHFGKMRGFENLDEETKQKIEEIHNQVKVGTLTKEEAQSKLQELGIQKFRKR